MHWSMHDKYKHIDLDNYKACLQEVGDMLRKNNDHNGFRKITAEWNAVKAYENSMIAPWD